jgi:hypothetical protein
MAIYNLQWLKIARFLWRADQVHYKRIAEI